MSTYMVLEFSDDSKLGKENALLWNLDFIYENMGLWVELSTLQY